MIYRLRKKFIVVSAISILTVFFVIYLGIFFISIHQLNGMVDPLADVIAANNGIFPASVDGHKPPPPKKGPHRDIFTSETRFSTRFFTVWVDSNGQIIRQNIESVSSVTKEEVEQYIKESLRRKSERGWTGDYRYKIFETKSGLAIVFVNGSMNQAMTRNLLFTALTVLVASGSIVLLMIILFSKRAVQPAVESYEKQKQFITDANHELKTPLTLILSNLDIVESELGENEWLDDIRSEGERMSALVNQLVTLSRMDEEESNLVVSRFDLSSAAEDMVSEFCSLAAEREKELSFQIEPNIFYQGDEGLIRRLLSILLDNAVKYCDPGGSIRVTLSAKRYPVIIVENTYKNVGKIELHRLFDRFYRGDKARTYTGSFGVGLSIAKAIAKNHRGDITACQTDDSHISFKVILK